LRQAMHTDATLAVGDAENAVGAAGSQHTWPMGGPTMDAGSGTCLGTRDATPACDALVFNTQPDSRRQNPAPYPAEMIVVAVRSRLGHAGTSEREARAGDITGLEGTTSIGRGQEFRPPHGGVRPSASRPEAGFKPAFVSIEQRIIGAEVQSYV